MKKDDILRNIAGWNISTGQMGYPNTLSPDMQPNIPNGNEGPVEATDLNDRQAAQYAVTIELVETFGQFEEDEGADGADYEEPAENPGKTRGIACKNCAFYDGPGKCEVVNYGIEDDGICKLWIIPESLITPEPEDDK